MKTAPKEFKLGGRDIKVSKIPRKPRKCECGNCDLYFIPWQKRQRFFNARHKAIWHKRQKATLEAS